MGSGKGGHGLPVAFETEAGLQFVGDELEVGRFLQGNELLEESDGFGRPVRPMVATGELGGEVSAVLQPSGAESVKLSAFDLEVVGGIGGIDQSIIELLKDLLDEQVGEAFGDLLFL